MGRLSGFAAKFPLVCPRCGRNIVVGDRVVRHRRDVIHVECAAGHDE